MSGNTTTRVSMGDIAAGKLNNILKSQSGQELIRKCKNWRYRNSKKTIKDAWYRSKCS